MEDSTMLTEFYITSLWSYRKPGQDRILDFLRNCNLASASFTYDNESDFFKVSCLPTDVQTVQEQYLEVQSAIEKDLETCGLLNRDGTLKEDINNIFIETATPQPTLSNVKANVPSEFNTCVAFESWTRLQHEELGSRPDVVYPACILDEIMTATNTRIAWDETGMVLNIGAHSEYAVSKVTAKLDVLFDDAKIPKPAPRHVLFSEVDGNEPWTIDVRYLDWINPILPQSTILDPAQFFLPDDYKLIFVGAASLRICLKDRFRSNDFYSLFGPRKPDVLDNDMARTFDAFADFNIPTKVGEIIQPQSVTVPDDKVGNWLDELDDWRDQPIKAPIIIESSPADSTVDKLFSAEALRQDNAPVEIARGQPLRPSRRQAHVTAPAAALTPTCAPLPVPSPLDLSLAQDDLVDSVRGLPLRPARIHPVVISPTPAAAQAPAPVWVSSPSTLSRPTSPLPTAKLMDQLLPTTPTPDTSLSPALRHTSSALASSLLSSLGEPSLLDMDDPISPGSSPRGDHGDVPNGTWKNYVTFSMEPMQPIQLWKSDDEVRLDGPNGVNDGSDMLRPRVRLTDEASTRCYHETMRQQSPAGSRVEEGLAQKPSFEQDMTKSFDLLLEPLRAKPGSIRLRAELGRIYVRNVMSNGLATNDKNELSNGWQPEVLLPGLEKACTKKNFCLFTKILSIFGGDAAFMSKVGADKGNPLWSTKSKNSIAYEFLCRVTTEDGTTRKFFVDIDGTPGKKFAWAIRRGERDEYRPVWVHCLQRHWDFRLILEYNPSIRLNAMYGNFAMSLARSLKVETMVTSKDRPWAPLVLSWHEPADFTIETVRVRKTARYTSKNNKSYLDIEQIYPLDMEDRQARLGKDDVKSGKFRSWFEASISSVTAEKLFQHNADLCPGDVVDWTREQFHKEKIFEAIYGPATEMVKNIDGVGVSCDNGQSKKFKGRATAESTNAGFNW